MSSKGAGMTTSSVEQENAPLARQVAFSGGMMTVQLHDGRVISVPIEWYPRLSHGTDKERGNWQLIGRGDGIRWPDLDEDLSVDGLLAGRRSGETERSFNKWLEARKKRVG
jgi:hypothetical protein